MSDALFTYLQGYFANRYPEAALSDFQFVASGWESDVYAFVLHLPSVVPQNLILRLYPDTTAISKMMREAKGLNLLRQAGYPAPAIFLTEPQSDYLNRPFTVMEKLQGRPLWPVLAAVPPSEADAMLDRFSSLLARLHQLDWRPFAENAERIEASPVTLLEDHFASLRQLYTQHNVRGFLLLLNWLETHKAEVIVRPATVHLDFHANNVFLCKDGHWTVIDWTQITVADFRLDLCWTLMIMGDFGQRQWGERIWQAYRNAVQEPIDHLDYFQVITYAKILASTVISLKTSPLDLGMRPETAASIAGQVPVLRKLAQHIQQITGLDLPEVEAALSVFP